MHILFLTDNFPPEVNAPASRTFEHCREWVQAGHQVTVITCAPNFPKGKVFEGYKNKLWQKQEMAGIKVIRVWSFMARNEGLLKRGLDYISYMISAIIAVIFVRRVDVIVGTSPQLFTACAAFVASIFKRCPWVFELRDLWPESIRAVEAVQSSRVLDALEKLEMFLYRKATMIVPVTHAFKANLISRGIDGTKIHVVTNGVDTKRFFPIAKDIELEKTLGLQGKFVLGYIGTHGVAHGLETLLDVAALLRDLPEGQNIRILMLGDGAQREALIERADREGLSNMLFLESVPKEDVVKYWSLLDASIIHLRKSDLFKTVIPSKLFECMGMGIPVIYGVEGESAEIVQQGKIGITLKPEDPVAMRDAILTMYTDADLRSDMAEKGPKAAQAYDRRHLADTLLNLLTGLTQAAEAPQQPIKNDR